MLKRLEREALQADIATVDSLLNLRSEEEDPVGWMQLSYRKQHLEEELSRFGSDQTRPASVGLFFGGAPVYGSRGIAVDFGTTAVGHFQSIVSSQFASLEGAVGRRGPLPQRDRTQMIITDVARGSFGFVLEDLGQDDQPYSASLGSVMDGVCELIYRVSRDEETFTDATDAVEKRVIVSLSNFFKHLDEANATVRLVGNDEREFDLPRDAVHLARERTESLQLEETIEDFEGHLYVLPDARRFELHLILGGSPLKGSVTPECMEQLAGPSNPVTAGVIGSIRRVRLRVREVRTRHQAPRKNYALLSVLPTAVEQERSG